MGVLSFGTSLSLARQRAGMTVPPSKEARLASWLDKLDREGLVVDYSVEDGLANLALLASRLWKVSAKTLTRV